MKKYEVYTHHDRPVYVRTDLKGKHRECCLCQKCSWFYSTDRNANCPIANLLFAVCVQTGITAPVWECPKFHRGKE